MGIQGAIEETAVCSKQQTQTMNTAKQGATSCINKERDREDVLSARFTGGDKTITICCEREGMDVP